MSQRTAPKLQMGQVTITNSGKTRPKRSGRVVRNALWGACAGVMFQLAMFGLINVLRGRPEEEFIRNCYRVLMSPCVHLGQFLVESKFIGEMDSVTFGVLSFVHFALAGLLLGVGIGVTRAAARRLKRRLKPTSNKR